MSNLNKNTNKKRQLVLSGLILVTLVLGALTLFTVYRLNQLGTKPIAPTAPESKPAASEGNQCTTTFAVAPSLCNEPCTDDNQCTQGLFCDQQSSTCRLQDNPTSTTCELNPEADLSLTKTASNTQPAIGEQTTFTITVTNSGPDQATGVSVEDLIPTGLSYISSTASQGSYNNTTGIWDIGAIDANASVTLEITVTVNQEGTVSNTAQVKTSDQPDPDSTPDNNQPDEDDQDQVSISTPDSPPSADLSLTKTASDTSPQIGEQTTFTITVSNAGPDDATGVTVKDLIPSGLSYVSSSPSQGTYNSTSGIWTIGTISASSSVTIDITVTVNQSGNVSNTAQVQTSTEPDPDSTPGNNNPDEDDQDQVTITPEEEEPQADLSLTKTASNTSPKVGEQTTFTITVSNSGPDNATGVTVKDLIPSGLSYVSSSPSQGSYNQTTGIWNIGTINANATATISITVTVNQEGTFANTAQVQTSNTDDPDSTPGNNDPDEDDQDQVSVSTPDSPPSADLSLTKTVSNSNPQVDQNTTFTIKVTNSGPDQATNVSVEDLIPSGLSYISSSASQGSYNSSTGIWNIGTLNANVSATLDITARVTNSSSVSNIAQVHSSDQSDPDSTPDNDNSNEDDQDQVNITPSTEETPELPKAGIGIPTLFVMSAGGLLLILGALGLLAL